MFQNRIGHRGHPGSPRYGENTIRSCHEAIMYGANMLEGDIRRTKDSILVVTHDETMDRVTGGKALGRVCDYTLKELQQFDVGYGQYVPTLAEVLDTFGGKIKLNIELKETGLSQNILDLVESHNLKYSILISAFDVRDDPDGADGTVTWDDLGIFVEHSIPIALLAGTEKVRRMREEGFVAEGVTRRAYALNTSLEATTSSLVERVHAAGLEVNVWTVNDPADIGRLVEIGVDGIFSDFVERLVH